MRDKETKEMREIKESREWIFVPERLVILEIPEVPEILVNKLGVVCINLLS